MKERLIQALILLGILAISQQILVKVTSSEAARKAITAQIPPEPRTPSKTWRVKPGSVHDGDTFRAVADGTNEEVKIRVACIDAPEIKQAGGVEARDYLRSMLPDNQEVILAVSEKDRYGRSVAEVYAKTDQPELEVGINGEMVKAGMAHYYERYKSACPDNAEMYKTWEETAIANKAGVWSNGNPERPWDWRKRNK